MKLSKQEITLLGVLAALVVIVGGYYLLLLPVQTDVDSKTAEYTQLELDQINMQTILGNGGLDTIYSEQKETAKDNYDSFYSTLNAYTIDNIISALMDDYAIDVTKLKILPYEPVEWETVGSELPESENAGAEENKNILLKSTVQIEAGGDYKNVMSFIDSMNAKSFCLRVHDMKIIFRTEQNLIEKETQFSCVVDIYGIETPEGLTFT